MLCLPMVGAQESLPDTPMRQAPFAESDRCAMRRMDIPCDNGPYRNDIPDFRQTQRRTLGIVMPSALAVGLYGKENWWHDGFTGSFRTVNEGWFGQHTYSGGADRFGHFCMNCAAIRLFVRTFE